MNLRYDILYLRFLSILSILLYHINSKIFKGGYLGVDVLLVITSYLNINSLLHKMKIEYLYINYIIKRSNRLIPSSLVVLYLCRNSVSDYNEIIYTLLFLSNYYYYNINLDYFHHYDLPSPLLHYWCLSLEYQFYFIIPLILCNEFKGFIIFISFFISLIIYFIKKQNNFSYCYYCFLPRLYQFAISYYIKHKSEENRYYILNYIITLIHTFIILLLDNEYVNIHIAYTILTFIIINKKFLDNHLSHFYLYFSQISYSIYLIHYPIIIICKYNIIIKVILISVSSIVLYIVCEKHLSFYLNKIKSLYIIIFYGICVLLCILMYRKKYNNHIDIKNKLWKDFNMYRKPCKFNFLKNNICSNVLLIGDSHMDQWIAGLYNYFITISVVIYFIDINGMHDISSYKMKHVLEKAKKIKYLELIIMCNFKYNTEFRNDEKFIKNIDRYYIQLQKELLNYSNNIIILNDNPHLLNTAYSCLTKYKKTKCYCILGINCTISDLPIYTHKSIHKCDINRYLCNKKVCQFIINKKYVYVDSHHLTPYIIKYLGVYLIKCINMKNDIKKKCHNINLNNCYYYLL